MTRKPTTLIMAMAAAIALLGPGTSQAHAYIDPGTGSSLFSSLGLMLGVCLAFAAMMLTQVKRCGQWFMAKLYFRREKQLGAPPAPSATGAK